MFRMGRDFTFITNVGFAAGFDSFVGGFGSVSDVLGVCDTALVNEAKDTKIAKTIPFA